MGVCLPLVPKNYGANMSKKASPESFLKPFTENVVFSNKHSKEIPTIFPYIHYPVKAMKKILSSMKMEKDQNRSNIINCGMRAIIFLHMRKIIGLNSLCVLV